MGQAYFFNLTAQPAVLTLNNIVLNDQIAALPSSAPYTPNHNGLTYNRYNGSPQANQFGNSNIVNYTLGTGGSGGSVTVTINVNVHAYPIGQDILVYMFQDAVVAMVVSDNNAYFGLTGNTITVDPNVQESKLSSFVSRPGS